MTIGSLFRGYGWVRPVLVFLALSPLVLAGTAWAQCANYANYSYPAGDILPTDQQDGHGAGIFVQGQYAYTAFADEEFKIFDVSDMSFPVLVYSYNFPNQPLRSIYVSGSIAAIVGNVGLVLFDVSDPFSPTLLGSLGSAWQVQEVVISGTNAYLTESATYEDPRFRTIDISDPSAPVQMASLPLPNYPTKSFAVSGDFAFVPTREAGLQILDISDPSNPSIANDIQRGIGCWAVVVSGNLAYVTFRNPSGDGELVIFDISAPTDPTIVGSVIPGTGQEYWHIGLAGTTCYLGYRYAPTAVVDCSDPTAPFLSGTHQFRNELMSDMAVFGDYLFEGRGNFGFNTVYVASSEPLVPISSLVTTGTAQNVVVSGAGDNLAYVADGDAGLKIIDVSDPLSPVLIDSVSTRGFAADVFLSGNYAFVADGDSGLAVIDVSNPGAKSSSLIGTLDIPGGYVADVSVQGDYAYLAVSTAGFRVADVSNLALPQIVGAETSLTLCQSVDVSGSYAYVTDGIAGLKVLDVSDPDNPWIIDGVKSSTWINASDVIVRGSKAYVTDSGNGLHVVDITTPNSVVEIGHTETTGQAMQVSVNGNYGYVADSESGMQLIDLEDPANPIIVGNIDFPEYALGTYVTSDYVYVAASSGGLQICPSQCGESDVVFANFSYSMADSFYPAVVSFTNLSVGFFGNTLWDFGDGVGTSTTVSPSYYYALPGDYDVSLSVSGSGNEDTFTRTIRILAAEPWISSVEDVPEDQGGYVVVNFVRSGYDDTMPNKAELYTIQRQYQGTWVTVATSGAYGDHTYSVLAATQGDGAAWNTPFRVIAHVDEGVWIGPTVHGFSEDNIAPAAPANVTWIGDRLLGWDDVAAMDFAYYRIYGGPSSDFSEAVPVTAVADNRVDLTGVAHPWVFVVAVDDAELESIPSSPAAVADVPDAVKEVQLSGAFPNPFNPRATIKYALPRTIRMRLAIYDLSGRKVRVLVDGVVTAGRHVAVWEGIDDAGRALPSGTYFSRLEAGDKVLTNRMMLLK